jgi:hypothetical protein
MSADFDWHQEARDQLRDLWGIRTLTCVEIAAQIGGVTKDAVIAMAHTMGLPSRRGFYRPVETRGIAAGASEREQRLRIYRRAKGWVEGSGLPPINKKVLKGAAWEALPGTSPVALEAATGCRWPIGEESPFTFCNAPAEGVYCAVHREMSRGAAAVTTESKLEKAA